MFENNLIAGSAGQATGFYPYAINQSLRFNDDDSAYLSRTPATAGNRKTWTWSAWVKRGNLEGITLFSAYIGSGSTNNQYFGIERVNDTIRCVGYAINYLTPSAVFRDISSWYHIVVSVNTTDVTANNRIRMYVNGSELTAFDTRNNPSLNADLGVNQAAEHNIGRQSGFGSHLDGYLAEINFIDGQALDPTSFGEFKSGVWVANEYTGTYGTNGFYLPFTNGLGDDESGNGNDWTPNNLSATDIVLDSPTNNFATLNPLAKGTNATLSEGNLRFNSAQTYAVVLATIGIKTGKWYWESLVLNSAGSNAIGIGSGSTDLDDYLGYESDFAYFASGGIFGPNNTESQSDLATFSANDIIGVSMDMDNNEVKFYKNNNLITTVTSVDTEIDRFPAIADNSGADQPDILANFGQDSSFAGNETAQGNTDENGIGDFYYTPPAGFLALCTANLPEPAISPADDESPSDYFNTVLYTGTGSTQSITGVGFQPDWVWIKSRNDTDSHVLVDAVRGSQKNLFSNETAPEQTVNRIDAFTSDGFDMDGAYDFDVNETGSTYVAWNWKADGAGVTNTNGSITSTVSASPESGFSIVNYTGTGSPESFGHGLSQRPDFVIVKNRDSTSPWLTKHFEVMTDDKNYLDLNYTAPVQTAGSTTFILSTSNNSVVSYGTSGRVSSDSNDYIAYCFHSVEGFSKFGSYTGNGSTDGPFVYTGFRPAFVLIKRTDSTANWSMFDTSRSSYNVMDDLLEANNSAAEGVYASYQIDFLSNGFKPRQNGNGINASGGTYIYMAFAENGGPFKFSNAR